MDIEILSFVLMFRIDMFVSWFNFEVNLASGDKYLSIAMVKLPEVLKETREVGLLPEDLSVCQIMLKFQKTIFKIWFKVLVNI